MRDRTFVISVQRSALSILCMCGCIFLVFLPSSVAFAKTTPSSTTIPVANQAKTSGSITPLSALGTINWTDAPIVAAFIMLAGQGAGFLLKCILDKRAIQREKREHQQERLPSNAGRVSVYDTCEHLHEERTANALAYRGGQGPNTHLLATPANNSVNIEAGRDTQDNIALAPSSPNATDNIPTFLRLLCNSQLDESIRHGIIEALNRLIREPQDLALLAEHMSASSELSDDAHQVLWHASRRLDIRIVYAVDQTQDPPDTCPDDG